MLPSSDILGVDKNATFYKKNVAFFINCTPVPPILYIYKKRTVPNLPSETVLFVIIF